MHTLNHFDVYDTSALIYLNGEKYCAAESRSQVSRVDWRYALGYLRGRERSSRDAALCLSWWLFAVRLPRCDQFHNADSEYVYPMSGCAIGDNELSSFLIV